MSDEGLDKIFQKGLANRNVDFNMAAWRNMEQMLPPEPKAAFFTFNKVASIIGLLLLAGASSLYLWKTNDNGNENLAVGTALNKDVPENEVSSISESPNGDKNAIEAINSNENTISSSSATAEKKLGNSTQDSEQNLGDESDIELNPGNQFIADEGSTQSGSKAASSSKNTTKIREKLFAKKGMNSLFSNKSNRKSLASNAQENKSGYYSDIEVNKVSEKQLVLSRNAFTKIDGLEELAAIALDEQESESLVIQVSNGKLPKADKNVLGIIGGININQSLVQTESTKSSVSEFAGITYQRYLNSGFSVKANLLYSSRTGVNTHKVFEDKHYDFGGWTESMEIEAQRLVYLELPVMANYGVRNHNFMAGASFSYLVNSLSSVTMASTHPLENTSDKFSTWGYNSGFASYDFSVVAGYEYSVTPQLNIGGRLNYGLIDVTDNNYFGSDTFDNNVQFRVYVTYSPFQF